MKKNYFFYFYPEGVVNPCGIKVFWMDVPQLSVSVKKKMKKNMTFYAFYARKRLKNGVFNMHKSQDSIFTVLKTER